MFTYQAGVTNLPCEPEDLLKVSRSMNMVKVSVDDHVSEPCETYIVTSQVEGAAGGARLLQTHIVFYLESPAVRAIFATDQNPYPASRRMAVETEASEMVEQMGAILEDAGWEGMSSNARVQWLSQEYLFRVGAKRPRPQARATGQGGSPASAGSRPPSPPSAPPAREVTGLESNFDDLLDQAFLGGAVPREAPRREAPVPAAPSPAAVVPPPAPARAAVPAPSPDTRWAQRALRFLAGF